MFAFSFLAYAVLMLGLGEEFADKPVTIVVLLYWHIISNK